MSNFVFAIQTLRGFLDGSIPVVGYEGTYAEDTAAALDQADLQTLTKAHAFQVEQLVALALEQTRNEPRPLRLPFQACFIDGRFFEPNSGVTIRGILVYERGPPRDGDGLVDDVVFHAFAEEEPEASGRVPVTTIRGHLLRDFSQLPMEADGSDFNYDMEDLRGFIIRIIANWYDIISEPDVVLVELRKGARSRSKFQAEHGEEPPVSIKRIVLRGQIKRDIQAIRLDRGGHARYSHRFWVKGHFRHLRAERYGPMGSNPCACGCRRRAFVAPFQKGRGILVQKAYEVRPENPAGVLEKRVAAHGEHDKAQEASP